MASRNSVNKPKNKLHASAHAKVLGKRRAARNRKNTASRSTVGRYSDADSAAARPTDSKAIALYTGGGPKVTSVMTNTTLSNKRAKKLARNQKYIDQRNNKVKEVEMDVEEKKSQLEKVKAALWTVVENSANLMMSPAGEGTTLGVQAF
ncbi:ribosome biogenesis protein ALB1 [Suhomyces tanzawaensis NRRL Y-17324]|uniref:Ribosome biogenesis protein ALB1 n=1 Tax=Suhomyces tanzawaensis NRRL Y-17324 TaxID=984487 RepID=A0A1E4SP30_9ASCO|nr:ribosome biogenesis protein ALB1 [Suhomyces tanzawaensis NRRL Y-17324]ODV81281.1 ribosome biogenesis protein ALB1 [Suhomyces tanzawaensis NRRL Y-17324]